jgi:hypothetical protein
MRSLYDRDMTVGTHPAKPASRPLPASLDYAELHVDGTAKLFGTDMDDPGLTQMRGTVSIFDFPKDEGGPSAATEGIGLSITQRVDGAEITILQAEGIVLDLDRVEDPYDSLDAASAELEEFGCLLDSDGGGLHPDLEHMLEAAFGRHILIVEHVRVAPAWRGFGGVGRYLAGRLLPLMCCDAAVVALKPFPVDVPRDERGNADEAALRKGLVQIRRAWKSIGFQLYRGDIWIMDPGANKHERAMARLERQLGLAGSPG